MTDAAAPADAPQVRGRCRTCGKDYTLRDDGTVLLHRDNTGRACPGSREPPGSVIRWPAPQVRVCAEPGCGRTSPPYKIIGRGYCERSYKRWERGRLGLAPLPNPADSPLLPPIKDAYRRVKNFERPRQQAMARFRVQVRLAYADGLSIGDISRATGHAPMTIHEHHLLPQQRRPSGGGTPAASPDKVDRWRPVLTAAAADLAAAREQEQESRRLLADLIWDAVSPGQPAGKRVSQRLVAAALGVSAPTVGGWLRRFPKRGSA